MAGAVNLSPEGIAAIQRFEGSRLTAYQDIAGIWTIGYGHTGAGVHAGLTITQEQADALFAKDVEWAERVVSAKVVATITQPQFDALVSLAYNIGAAAFSSSTLVRKLNAGDVKGAASEFLRWNRSGGQVVEGLRRRRESERALFLKDMSVSTADTVQGIATVAGAATGNVWLGPAISILRNLWPELKPLVTEGSSEVATRNVRAAEAVVNAVIQATGAPNAQAAIEAVQADQSTAQAARSAAVDALDRFGLVDTAGVADARKFSQEVSVPFYKTIAFATMILLSPIAYFVVGTVMWPGSAYSNDAKMILIGMVATGIIGGMTAFSWGTTASSRLKDETIAAQARR